MITEKSFTVYEVLARHISKRGSTELVGHSRPPWQQPVRGSRFVKHASDAVCRRPSLSSLS